MKILSEVITQEPVYLNNWNTKQDVISDFVAGTRRNATDADEAEFGAIHILFASYGTDNYCGDAWVLFERDGELWEVCGGHCSCYGLEGQWAPEKAFLPELENRILNGQLGHDNYSGNVFRNELATFLDIELPSTKAAA